MGEGTQNLEHREMTIDIMKMTSSIPERKIQLVEALSRVLMKRVRANRPQVDVTMLGSFSGVRQSLSLAVPEPRFRLRAVRSAAASLKKRNATLREAVIKDVL